MMDEDDEREVLFHYETASGWPYCGINKGNTVTNWERVNCRLCIRNKDYCHHPDFYDKMDGSGTCRDCGLYVEGLADKASE